MADNAVAIAFMILDVLKLLLNASQKKLPFRFSGKAIYGLYWATNLYLMNKLSVFL